MRDPIGRRRPCDAAAQLECSKMSLLMWDVLEIKMRGFLSPNPMRRPQRGPERETAALQVSETGLPFCKGELTLQMWWLQFSFSFFFPLFLPVGLASKSVIFQLLLTDQGVRGLRKAI